MGLNNMTERSKRNVKLPKHLEDAGTIALLGLGSVPRLDSAFTWSHTGFIDPSLGETKFVYRHLRKDELTGSLAQETVYVLWPDDGIWYQAQVKKVRWTTPVGCRHNVSPPHSSRPPTKQPPSTTRALTSLKMTLTSRN